jgi:hypothetical protein
MHPRASNEAHALIQLQKHLRRELKSEFKKSIPQEKTSVVGGSSVLSDHNAKSIRIEAEIERRKLKAEQERVIEIFRR